MKSLKSVVTLLTLIAVSLLLGACDQGRTSGKGLVLPAGTVEDGKATFVNMGCVYCHSIPNVELATAEFEVEPEPLLVLGGKVRKVKTYGELVTSIINPEHVISPAYLEKIQSNETDSAEMSTPMPSFNDEMTVSQLIDLVTFLDAQYEQLLPEYVSERHGFGNY